MGRSQRHNLWEHGATAAGYIHSQGVVAPGIAMQVDPENIGVLKAGPPLYNDGLEWKHPEGRVDLSEVVVPVGDPGGPLSGSTLTGAIPEGLQPEIPPDPAPGEEPTLNSINPNSAQCGSADLTMTVIGNRFTDTSLVFFQGQSIQTTYVNQGELHAVVQPSLYETPVTVDVWVQQGSFKTEMVKTFSFTEASVEGGERTFPAGPFAINHIEDHADGIAIAMAEGDIRVGDAVLVEATGNTSVNGAYTVLSIFENVIVVDNNTTLDAPIEAKGRVTVTGGT